MNPKLLSFNKLGTVMLFIIIITCTCACHAKWGFLRFIFHQNIHIDTSFDPSYFQVLWSSTNGSFHHVRTLQKGKTLLTATYTSIKVQLFIYFNSSKTLLQTTASRGDWCAISAHNFCNYHYHYLCYLAAGQWKMNNSLVSS